MTNSLDSSQLNFKFLDKISDSILIIEINGDVIFQNKVCLSNFGAISNFNSFFSLQNQFDAIDTSTDTNSWNIQNEDYNFEFNQYNENYFYIVINSTKKITEESTIHSIYYKIGNLTKTTKNLDDLLEKIHHLLIEEMHANNMTVCIDNKANNSLDFIYYYDEESGGRKKSYSREKAKGLTEYVLETQQAHLLYQENIIELKNNNIVEPIGEIPQIWIGVPMIYNDELIGVLSVKSHSSRKKFNFEDLEFLKFITIQISFGIERKAYEDKITDQTARLKSIFESGDHLIWSVNKQRKLTSFNENYALVIEKLHGVRPKIEDSKNKILLLSDGEFTELITNKYNLAFQGIPQQYETSFEEINGVTTWRQMFLSPIFSADGKINQISGIAHDVTYKKLNELAITESEKKFRHIFETLQDIYIRINGRDEIEIISPSILQITGFEPHELIGRNVREFFIPKHKGDLELLTRLMHDEKSIKNFELNLLTKTGELIPSIANLDAVLNNHNKTIGVQGTIRDIYELQTITEELKKAKQEAEHSLKVKENFLANMSHEIRTPMNGIVAMIDMLQTTKLNHNQKEYVSTIYESSHILMKILNDILDLSKLEAGKMDIRKEEVSIKDIIQKSFLLFSQRAKSKNIIFNFHVDPKIPKRVISDETRLIQILLNLTSNAIKFTQVKGEVSITAQIIEDFDNWISVKFEIKDSGIGIDKNEIQKLFQSFNQVDSSITKEYGGTGLGLSISQELCSLLGGKIEVDSKKGKGSNFHFTLNFAKTKESYQNDQLGIINPSEKRNLKNLKILVVDDNEVNRKVCSLLLNEEKAIVQLASNGSEALNLVHSTQFDIILMDIQMPVMDGVTALNHIKKISAAKKTKIIAVTAFSMEKDREHFIELGFNNYLAKPITRDTLIKSILDDPKEKSFFENDSIANEFLNLNQQKEILKIGGEALFLEVMNDFKNETDLLIIELKNAIRARDLTTIHQIAHQIKGSAGSVGLTNLYKICHKIEQEIKNLSNLEAYAIIEEVFKEYEVFEKWMKLQNHEKNINR